MAPAESGGVAEPPDSYRSPRAARPPKAPKAPGPRKQPRGGTSGAARSTPEERVELEPVDQEPTDVAAPERTSGSPGTPKGATAPKGLRGRRTRRERGRRRTDGGTRASADGTRPASTSGPGAPKGRRLIRPGAGAEEAPRGRKGGASKRRSLVQRFGGVKRRDRKAQQKRNPVTPIDRRRRIPVALAALFAVTVLATSFPISAIISQHRQLSAASTQLHQLQDENRSLAVQEHELNSKVAINEMAREDFQMVSPGQTLFDVLPPNKKTGRSTSGTSTTGDPADQPLVTPAEAPDLSPQPGLPAPIPTYTATPPTRSASSTSAPAKSPSTFWGRVTDTLEFWN
ncbi:MAG: septum formation initiator family protein [Acidimicrobiales bacterium]